MTWLSNFDPTSIHADLAPGDKAQRQRKSTRSAVSKASYVEKGSSDSAYRGWQRYLAGRTNGMEPLSARFEKEATPLAPFASWDFASLSTDQAGELIEALKPVYLRMKRQPGFLKDRELKDCLANLQLYAEAKNVGLPSERYHLKNLGYYLAKYFREAGDIESSVPQALIIDHLATLLGRFGSARSY